MYFQLHNISRSVTSQEAIANATYSAVVNLENITRQHIQTVSQGGDDPDVRSP
jgi:hypothetical protein